MALLKNLYLDLGYMNPFRKNKSKLEKKEEEFVPSIQVQQKKVELKELPQVSKQIIISEAKKLELPKIVRKQVEQPARIDSQKPAPMISAEIEITKPIEEKKQTYFSNVTSKELIHKDLFKEMQTFWQDQKNQTVNMQLSRQMNEEVSKKIDELQIMELEWQKMQLEHERMKDELSSKELYIENHIKDLKKRFKGMHFHAHTPDNNNFVLSNGVKLRSLNDLSNALPKMEDSVFYSHVNDGKNDFSNWVRDVMNLGDLSEKISSAKDRQEMQNLLHDWKNSH